MEVSILGWETRKLSPLVAIQVSRQSPARNDYKRMADPATIFLYPRGSLSPCCLSDTHDVMGVYLLKVLIQNLSQYPPSPPPHPPQWRG